MPLSRPTKLQDKEAQRSIDDIVREVNRTTDELEADITGAGEVAVAHGLDFIPTSFFQVVTQTTTGQGVLYPGTTAWTNALIYVRASSTGLYHLRVRR